MRVERGEEVREKRPKEMTGGIETIAEVEAELVKRVVVVEEAGMAKEMK